MKKLNLQLGSIKEMLTKEQMKKVSGGYDFTCYGLDGDGNYTGSGTITAVNCCDAQAIADHDAWNDDSFPYGIDCPCDMNCN